MKSARQLLGPSGPFAAQLEGYEPRTGQLEAAAAVERVLASDGVLLCEAGTGTGKTFAYLVPALLSGRKVIISTATRALQDQIAERDLPLVQRVLGTDAQVAVMKGLGNYLCKRRHSEFLRSEEALRPTHARPLELMRRWIGETESGDHAELASLSESSATWFEVASSSETRVGPNCPYYDECFVTEMKRRAEDAQIVIVNHHLFFADLALRGPHPGHVLPDYDAVVLDEAHQIEDIASLFFGIRVARTQLERMLRDAARVLGRASVLGGPLDPAAGGATLSECDAAHQAFWTSFEPFVEKQPRAALDAEAFSGTRREPWLRFDRTLEALAAVCSSRAASVRDDQALTEGLEQSSRRAQTAREQLEAIVTGGKGRVTWVEHVNKTWSLSSTPVDLSYTLRERLFDSVPAVVLTSATLSTAPSASSSSHSEPPPSSGRTAQRGSDAPSGKRSAFSFMRARLGISDSPAVEEMVVPSPFDYERQALLYTPRDLPAPSDARFLDAAADRIAELVELTEGGAFVLTTSLRSMRGFYDRLNERIGDRPMWLQGERPKSALLAAFRASGRGVLVATQSFWEGVDVPGAALRLVVLEKVPFLVPTDPVVQARAQALEAAGKSSFAHLMVPEAAIALKQGFGRLIRRQDDVGIVALLDERIHSRGYGKRLLNALPPAERTDTLDVVRRAAARWGERVRAPKQF